MYLLSLNAAHAAASVSSLHLVGGLLRTIFAKLWTSCFHLEYHVSMSLCLKQTLPRYIFEVVVFDQMGRS